MLLDQNVCGSPSLKPFSIVLQETAQEKLESRLQASIRQLSAIPRNKILTPRALSPS